jgi:hypothetical protein
MSLVAKIVYPAVPMVPDAPALSEIVAGALAGRTEYYVLTYVTPDGETLAGDERSIVVDASNVVQVAPPDYPYPFPIYGYNVYGASTSSAEVLQNTSPVLAGQAWTEPATGLVTGSATPPVAWSTTTLTFGRFTFPTKVPAYDRAAIRHSNVAASGLLETIYEHTDHYTDITVEAVQIGADVDNWNTFVIFAERGGIFSFYPDSTANPFTDYTLWDAQWTAAYRSVGLYNFKMKWREAGSSGGGVI